MTLHDRHAVFLDRGAKFAVWIIFIACPHSWARQAEYVDTVLLVWGGVFCLFFKCWQLPLSEASVMVSDCVCTPGSTCCPPMFTLGLYTKLWRLWLKHCCFLDVAFLHPFQVDKRFFFFPIISSSLVFISLWWYPAKNLMVLKQQSHFLVFW